MSDFKIVCGINPDQKAILNFEKVVEVDLLNGNTMDLTNGKSVVLYSQGGGLKKIDTNLTTLEQVRICLDKELECIFTLDTVIEGISLLEADMGRLMTESELLPLGLKRENNKIVPIKEGE